MVIAEALVPERRGAVAFLSSTNRDGDWILPRSFRVVACTGNVELDLSNVRLGVGESHIEIRCIFGNVEITVPLASASKSKATTSSGAIAAFARSAVLRPRAFATLRAGSRST